MADFEKEIGKVCMATCICRHTGVVVRCQKAANHEGSPHEFAGLQWDDVNMGHFFRGISEGSSQARPVPTCGSDLRFTIEGLWLTFCGRIVKPGPGEICSTREEGGNDCLLLTEKELQNGISLKEFRRRLNHAVRTVRTRRRR